jgi:bifunctional DNA-binding transcriptional regulator/antitoxin component of YhaV-PrlF toxin-antitoxin module
MMTASDVVESSEITRDSLREQYLQLDTRGRVTIPSSIRSLHGVDPEDDDHEIWVELSIKSIDVVGASDDEEGGDS